MGLIAAWRRFWLRRKFDRIGAGCELPAIPLDIRGHIELGDEVVIRGNVVLRTHKRGKIVLGHGVELADYALLQSSSLIDVGDHAYIGPYTVLRDTNHLFQGTDVHWRLTPHDTTPIYIGAKAYLAAGSYVMPGVTVGEGALIAPRSIVSRDVPPYEVWGGSPARKLAHRLDENSDTMLKRQLDLARLFGFGAAAERVEPET